MDTKISYFYLSKVNSDIPVSVYDKKLLTDQENQFIVSPRFGIINADISKEYQINFQLLVVDDPDGIIAEKSVRTGPTDVKIRKENEEFVINELRIPASGNLTFEIQLNLFQSKLVDSKIVYLRLIK